MSALRTFIALPALPAVQQAIAEVQIKLKAVHADVKWEPKDKFHITLIFLGNVDQSKLELLSAALATSFQQFHSCTISYESLGAFPNIRNPRVIWIGIRSNQTVLDLQSAAGQICAESGFPLDDRTFHPHITLGRVKEARQVPRLTEAIKTITFDPIEMHCSEIVLMKSDLHSSGSIYTILKSFPLHT
jgi:RNA 2',3'-cyclic 3'-phosphodiesterase